MDWVSHTDYLLARRVPAVSETSRIGVTLSLGRFRIYSTGRTQHYFMNDRETKPLTMMCVVAHPDDESIGFGGALALAAERSIKTYVVCLTDGQAATFRGNTVSDAELGILRRREFRNSCEVLGVAQYEIMDYQDGKLEFLSVAASVGQLVQRMRRFQPDVVVTFGSDGALNLHADHTVTSLLTTAAFHWSGRGERYPDLGAPHKPDRLFHLTTAWFPPNRRPPMPIPWTVVLNVESVQHRKWQAIQQHVSQAPIFEKMKPLFDQYGASEHYALVATPEPLPARQAADLFENIR
jgi:LmbE family N-acetylglucosaminyl deacetylase